jgi:hypothetical protein
MQGASRCAHVSFVYIICVHYLGNHFVALVGKNNFQSMNEQITKYAGRMQCAPTLFGNIGWKINFTKLFGRIVLENHI